MSEHPTGPATRERPPCAVSAGRQAFGARSCDNGSGTRGAANTAWYLTHRLDSTEGGLAVNATRKCSEPDCERPHWARGYCGTHYLQEWKRGLEPLPPRTGPTVHEQRVIDAAARKAARVASRPQGCTIPGCEASRVQARAMCAKHYNRWKRHGDPEYQTERPSICAVNGCESEPISRGWCVRHYSRWLTKGDPEAIVKVGIPGGGQCSVDACGTPAHSVGLCSMHRARMERTGSIEPPPPPTYRWITSGGYVKVVLPDHPLATKRDGSVYEHRVRLYGKIGPDPIACHWCGGEVRWDAAYPADGRSALVVDHLDEVKTNNDPDNLVPSCAPCNLARSSPRHVRAKKARVS